MFALWRRDATSPARGAFFLLRIRLRLALQAALREPIVYRSTLNPTLCGFDCRAVTKVRFRVVASTALLAGSPLDLSHEQKLWLAFPRRGHIDCPHPACAHRS